MASNFTIRTIDPQVTVDGRTFAIRHNYIAIVDAPQFLLLEKQGADWINVGDNYLQTATHADFATEEATVAYLKKIVAWLNAQFTRILGSAGSPPPEPTETWGDGSKADLAMRRIKLTVNGNTIVASL